MTEELLLSILILSVSLGNYFHQQSEKNERSNLATSCRYISRITHKALQYSPQMVAIVIILRDLLVPRCFMWVNGIEAYLR